MYMMSLKCYLTEDLNCASPPTQEWFSKDLVLTKTLLEVPTDVCDGNAAKMVACKRQILVSGKASQSSGSKGGGGNQSALGSAALISTVQDLICVKEAFKFKDRVQAEVIEKEDYKVSRDEVTEAMWPWRDLRTVVKKRTAAIDTRQTAWKNIKDSKNCSSVPTVFLNLFVCFAIRFQV